MQEKTVDKLTDSFRALAKEYRISERWKEHFYELFTEIEHSETLKHE